MTETVVVAIIAAVATLTASLLASLVTSWITLRNTRQQGEHQLRLAHQEWANQLRLTHEGWANQRAVEHQGVRRRVYERFISDALDATAVVRRAREPGLPEAEFEARYAAARSALLGLIPAHALVQLEGPHEVVNAVVDVRATLEAELNLIREVRQGSTPESKLDEAREKRAVVTGAMAEKARNALGGDIDDA